MKTRLLEELIGCKLDSALGAMSANITSVERFLKTLPTDVDEDTLKHRLTPQWVVLAAGKGSRIDATGRLSKTLDIMFGEQNTLQRSRRYLPGNRPHIIVINAQMMERSQGAESTVNLFGKDTILSVQSEMSGTGGALQAALPELQNSDADCIGVAFGDEPFLEKVIFSQTLLSHFLSGADVTLCGKVPETVVDKGGFFFDDAGHLVGTKEWYDMTAAEKSEMQRRHERGEAYTNTGITLIRKSALLERIHRLRPHKNRHDELHHVDLIRLCYEDGLKTNAFIYQGEVLSGVNRWANVLVGETKLFDKTRLAVARQGVRVEPGARITIEGDAPCIGTGCYLLGRVHLGANVRIGDYCRLENVTLRGVTTVGDAVGLQDVSALDTVFEANPLPATLAEPIYGLATGSSINNCTFDAVKVGNRVQLSAIQAYGTVIPSEIALARETLGVPLAQSPPGVPTSVFTQIVAEDYRPGVFTFGEKRELPDWNKLRCHVQTHSVTELIPRATQMPFLQQITGEAVRTVLNLRRADDTYFIESLTPEELWGTIFEMVTCYTGNQNPYHHDKMKARQTALALLPEFWKDDWLTRIKLVVAGNIIDYSSARVVSKLNAAPNYFSDALRAAVKTPFAIDGFAEFQEKVIQSEPKQILWLADNDGEIIFDMALIQDLVECGHRFCVVGKADNASNDVTLSDLREIVNYPQFQQLRTAMAVGAVTLLSSGAKTIGTNLYQATPAFVNALLEAELVISKGQGNFYTTSGWAKDTFYLLLSKGLTAEQTTGVVADKALPIDGLILAYVPGKTKRAAPLREICAQSESTNPMKSESLKL